MRYVMAVFRILFTESLSQYSEIQWWSFTDNSTVWVILGLKNMYKYF